MEHPAFIVAEVSKNWINGVPYDGVPLTIGQLFEHVINTNYARGYRLASFQLHRVSGDDWLNETIIAVFGLKDLEPR